MLYLPLYLRHVIKRKKRIGIHFSNVHAKVKHYKDEPDSTQDGINKVMF